MSRTLALPPQVGRFARLHDYSAAWSIDMRSAQTLWTAAQRMDWNAHMTGGSTVDGGDPREDLDAVLIDHRPNGVSIVYVDGVVMKHASSFAASTSTIRLRRVLRELADDPRCVGVVLKIDSPGGTCSGTEQLAAEVASLAALKPVHALVDDLCASAAYWIASQCHEIHAACETAETGSIGTYLGIYDLSKQAEQEGIEAVLIATHPLKGAGFPGTEISEDQRAEFRRTVDQLQTHFGAAVARGRGIAADRLVPESDNSVATGQCWLAADALQLGLIDGIRTEDEVVEAVAAAAVGFKSPRNTADGMPATALDLAAARAAALGNKAMSTDTSPAADDAETANTEDANDTGEAPAEAGNSPEPGTESETDGESAGDAPSNDEADADAKPDSPDAGDASKASTAAPASAFQAEFGKTQGSIYFADGLSLGDARAAEVARLKAENEELRKASASTAPAKPAGTNVPHQRSTENKAKKSAFEVAFPNR